VSASGAIWKIDPENILKPPLEPTIVTAGFYRSEPFLAEFQRKKNQALFLPRPVRKYGFCSLGSLGGFMADGRSRLLFSPFSLTD
jgi:hypothetical protein